MKNLAFIVLGAALALAALWIIKPSPEPATTPIVEEQTHWREDYAYHMGIAALNYAYPWYRMAHVRWNWTHGHVDTNQTGADAGGLRNRMWLHRRACSACSVRGSRGSALRANPRAVVARRPRCGSLPCAGF